MVDGKPVRERERESNKGECVMVFVLHSAVTSRRDVVVVVVVAAVCLIIFFVKGYNGGYGISIFGVSFALVYKKICSGYF